MGWITSAKTPRNPIPTAPMKICPIRRQDIEDGGMMTRKVDFMKRFCIFVIVSMLALFMTACGRGNANDNTGNTPLQGERVTLSAGFNHTIGLKPDGTVVADGQRLFNPGQFDVEDWTDIVSVSGGDDFTVGLKPDGTVVAVGYNSYGQINVEDWRNIIAISAGGDHTVGLKSDGTVVTVGNRAGGGLLNVRDWVLDVNINRR
jgi:alpha-tubulin suppressor-like RCC1 family protein